MNESIFPKDDLMARDKRLLIQEVEDAQLKAEEIFDSGFDMGVVTPPELDEYRRVALNYAIEISQTLGAIKDMLENNELS